MKPHLATLRRELAFPLPHPDADTAAALGRQTADWVTRWFMKLPEEFVGQTGTRVEMEALLREPPPARGRPFTDVFARFEAHVAAHALRPNHPRFLAFIPSAPTLYAVLGDWLCAGTNFFDGVWLEAAGPAQVELVVLDWFKEFLGLPREAAGILTGGGSEANLTALLAAREPLTFAERDRAVLFVTEQRHWSVNRAAKVIGLRPEQSVPVPTDEQFRMRPTALAELARQARTAGRLPWAVIANAGATNTGAVDPLAALADVCREERLWLHVDAAYGWPAVLIPEGKATLVGIERADSVTLDPHKWFAQPFEAGCLLVRDGRRLPATFAMLPEYMQDVAPAEDEVNFCDYGLALTRRFRALKIWLSIQALGMDWYRNLIDRCCRLTDFAQLLLEHSPNFEILCPRNLSIVCFRYVNAGLSEPELDQLNLALVDALRLTGRAFLSSTRLHGRVALRMCFVNWRTTATDVEEIVRLLAEHGEQLTNV